MNQISYVFQDSKLLKMSILENVRLGKPDATDEEVMQVIEAGATRLRPILMTTLTTVVSMIPMALAYGDSGKSMQGLALVDVGGLVASTILALLMLPIYYEVMSPKRKPEPHYD